jgi:hypothetical protein
MRGADRITRVLWPGLHRLWYHGELTAMAAAVAFAALLNLMLLVSFFQHVFFRVAPFPTAWIRGGWIVVAVFWSVGLWLGTRSTAAAADHTSGQPQEDLFIRAQSEYLKGHWLEAQTLLEQILSRHPGDIESLLLLSSVYRRSRRLDLSRRQLTRLQGLAMSERWRLEIGREMALLDRALVPGAEAE